ncbi:glycosyltransferase family 2 protein [uncultured Mesonia sp.]|uniref:glycosyltransferase family 2 protein n=1 Tax=uncultured Mesonia sp. TaxID=399731 RepID=UPI00374FA891
MENKVTISIVVITYNHAKFINQALNGIVSQKFDGSIELIISNDNSTDNTNEKINCFLKKFNQERKKDFLIKYYNHPKNLGAIPNFKWSLSEAQGKYIAICEGDDYWTDPYKLQKQVDFLENNPEYVVCSHNAKIIDSNGVLLKDKKIPQLTKDRDYSPYELQTGAFLLTLGMVFRNVIKDYPPNFSKVLNGDTFLISILGAYGKGKYLENIQPAAYRIHEGGIWSTLETLKRLKASRVFNKEMMVYHKNNKEVFNYWQQKQRNVSRKLLRLLAEIDNFKDYFSINIFYITQNPVFTSRYRLKELLKQNYLAVKSII